MLRRHLIAVAALVVGATTATADFGDPNKRKIAYIENELSRGRHEIGRLEPDQTRPMQLYLIRNASRNFRNAHNESFRDLPRGPVFAELLVTSDEHLASALVKEARIYYDRNSMPLARERVREALRLSPDDEEAQRLAALIDLTQNTTGYATIADRRINGRRGSFGPRPLPGTIR